MLVNVYIFTACSKSIPSHSNVQEETHSSGEGQTVQIVQTLQNNQIGHCTSILLYFTNHMFSVAIQTKEVICGLPTKREL